MAQPMTLGQLVKKYFHGKLCVDAIADLKIVVTNQPRYENVSFTVVAAAAEEGYPLFHSDSDAFLLTDLNLKLTYNGPAKRSTGWVHADMGFGGIDFNVIMTLSDEAVRFEADSQLKKPIALMPMLEKLFGNKLVTPPGLAASTKVTQAGMKFGLDGNERTTVSVSGKLSGGWKLTLAATNQTFQLGFRVESAWTKKKLQLTNAYLDGTLKLAQKATLELTYCFGPKANRVDLRAEAQSGSSLSIVELASLFGVTFNPAHLKTMAGRVPELEADVLDFQIDFDQKSYLLSGKNIRGDALFIMVEKFSDTWGLAIVIETPKGWKLGELTPKLHGADFVAFDHAFLGLSTHECAVPNGIFENLGENVFQLVAGLNFGAVVAFNRAASQASPLTTALFTLFGKLDLFLEATIGATIGTFSIHAGLGSQMNIPLPTKPKTQLTIAKPQLRFTPAKEQLAVSGSIDFPIENGKSMESVSLYGSFSISAGRVDFAVVGSQDNSLSLQKAHGVELKQIGADIGFSLTEPGVDVQLAGDMIIGTEHSNDEFAMAVLLPEFEPTLLYASFSRIDLSSMFRSLCAAGELPPALKKGIAFEGITIWMCAEQTGCTLADKAQTSVKTGFGFKATAYVFGFLAEAGMDIEPTSMKGSLQVKKRLRIPGILEMSDTTGKTGPYFLLDTTQSELDINCAFDVLGVKFSEGFSFGPDGFSFATHFSFKGNKIKLNGTVGATRGGMPVLSISGGQRFRKLSVWGVTVKRLTVSFDTRAKNPAFVATATVQVGVTLDKTVHVSVGQIEHELVNLGREIEKELKSVF